MANRKAAEAAVIKYLKELEGGDVNAALYTALFKSMSDAEFERWIDALGSGRETIHLIIPNANDIKLDINRTVKVGEELGAKFFEQLVLTDPETGEEYITPLSYMVLDVAMRRQSQHLIKKQSIPEDDRVVDHLSGQVTGDSKGGKISLPELLVIESKGLETSLLELIKVRGGDDVALAAMKEAIRESGTFNVKAIEALGSKPTAIKTLRALLLSVHLDNTIGEQ